MSTRKNIHKTKQKNTREISTQKYPGKSQVRNDFHKKPKTINLGKNILTNVSSVFYGGYTLGVIDSDLE